MESEQLFHRGYYRNSYNSITSASSDEELLDGAGAIMDFQTSEDDNLLDGDTAVDSALYSYVLLKTMHTTSVCCTHISPFSF
ncbi:H(+)/Cl(-) exchange transporter 3-like [Microtus oregoni]|uniref:H(+)/Cl(-) exchange transporter 3-like n=1 Tax=Microtus oregoni TaxID=111838 RepID=UPI001BB15756|nr:H(+)/Cl(-) exchange transporter 3-like [Microtus oregoni]